MKLTLLWVTCESSWKKIPFPKTAFNVIVFSLVVTKAYVSFVGLATISPRVASISLSSENSISFSLVSPFFFASTSFWIFPEVNFRWFFGRWSKPNLFFFKRCSCNCFFAVAIKSQKFWSYSAEVLCISLLPMLHSESLSSSLDGGS